MAGFLFIVFIMAMVSGQLAWLGLQVIPRVLDDGNARDDGALRLHALQRDHALSRVGSESLSARAWGVSTNLQSCAHLDI